MPHPAPDVRLPPASVGTRRRRGMRDVPYVPTAESLIPEMLDLARVGAGDVVYDLGCGDGRIVIEAAKRGARGVGVDIDRLRVRECHWNAERAGVLDRVRFVRGSLFDMDLRPASVVTLFLLPSINRRLRPRLMSELAPGARVVSNYFDMGDWKPDGRSEARGRVLYMWVVPAWVEGTWKCVVNLPGGPDHMILRLRRQYQKLVGTAQVGRDERPIADGILSGRSLSFKVPGKWPSRMTKFAGRVDGGQMRGTCRYDADDAPAIAWGGIWRA